MEKLVNEPFSKALFNKIKDNNILNLIDNKKAEIHITGLSLDIFRLRPEILTVFIVHEYKFYDKFMTKVKVNWKIKDEEEGIVEYTFNDEKAYNDLLIDKKTPLVSPAISALVLGREFILKNNLLKK